MSHLSQEAVQEPDPGPTATETAQSRPGPDKPEVAVLLSTTQGTIPAFRRAVALAREIGARLRLIILEEVSSPLEPGSAPGSAELMIRRLWTAVPTYGVESRVQIYRCRDKEQALGRILGAPSIVVIGGGRGWWLADEKRSSRLLEKCGHLAFVLADD